MNELSLNTHTHIYNGVSLVDYRSVDTKSRYIKMYLKNIQNKVFIIIFSRWKKFLLYSQRDEIASTYSVQQR